VPAQAVYAQDPDLPLSPHHEAARVIAEELVMTDAANAMQALSAQQPATLAQSVRRQLLLEAASYDFRVAARQEEVRVYELAGYATVQSAVVPLIPSDVQGAFEDAIAGLHSLYILEGIDAYYLVNAHFLHPYATATPLSSLRSFYAEAQQTYGVDASYLAAINYIESNFGRVNGPSSAGALGPMQFEPGTWADWGQGGDVMNPHDAILAAARYLVHYGALFDIRTAIWHYNLDYNYVDAVESFARAFRADPAWLDRMYYWNTTG